MNLWRALVGILGIRLVLVTKPKFWSLICKGESRRKSRSVGFLRDQRLRSAHQSRETSQEQCWVWTARVLLGSGPQRTIQTTFYSRKRCQRQRRMTQKERNFRLLQGSNAYIEVRMTSYAIGASLREAQSARTLHIKILAKTTRKYAEILCMSFK